MNRSIPVAVAACALVGCGAPSTSVPNVTQTPQLAARATALTPPPSAQILRIPAGGKVRLGQAFVSVMASPPIVGPGGISTLWPEISSTKTVSLAEFQWLPSCGMVTPGVSYQYEAATFTAPAFDTTCVLDANVLIAYADGTSDSGWVSTTVSVMGR